MVDNGDGTVTDTETGLMWMKNANNGQMTWDDAMSWAQDLLLAGYDDWRLPSGLNRSDGQLCNSQPAGVNCPDTEFGTLYFGYGVNYINSGVFQNVAGGSYWTSTEFPDDPTRAMAQDMIDGGQNPLPKGQRLSLWAVRDALPTDQPALVDNGDGTVVDTAQCLTWTKDANLPCTLDVQVSSTGACWFHSLAAAEEWAANLVYAGYDDWRLSSEVDPLPPNSELEYLFYGILGNPPGGPIANAGPFENVLQSTDFTYYDDNGQTVTIQRVHDDYWISIFPGSPLGREPSFGISDQSYHGHFMTDGETLSAWAVRDGCDITPP